ncbi:uncharacterized protein A4U43_C04F2010 [Asparagus officinalis]|uniref:Uncharacterized protein n=1 Tax=Asparagus officinalis TaxID=4686 RepID=A0A5P1EY93_ASPOF|nr:uncharacterized protein A4U43_C04F2010 [Asparagus officinalis]
MKRSRFVNMESKKAAFIIVVILASLVSDSFAGGSRKLVTKSTIPTGEENKDQSCAKFPEKGEVLAAHPRILVVKTNDYGSYDPSPSFSRPGFKPIPN